MQFEAWHQSSLKITDEMAICMITQRFYGTEDLVHNANFDGGTGTLLISGSGTKTFTTLAGGVMMGINFNAANVTLNGPIPEP